MFSVYLRKTLFRSSSFFVDSATLLLSVQLNNRNNHSLLLRFISTKLSTDELSFKVTYLIDSCGLSPESAVSVSEKIHFETLDKPDSVLNLLRNHGFSKTHISKLVELRPKLLLSKPEKTLLPKLEFFKSIGISMTDLARTPDFFLRSLKNQIVPSYNVLKSVLHSNEKVVVAMKLSSRRICQDNWKNLVPNTIILREYEVPQSCISLLLTNFPSTMMLRHDHFKEAAKKVMEMGLDPSKSMFVLGLNVMSGKNKLMYDRCYKVYRRWGLSKDEILSAFRKQPQCMTLSEEKLMRVMDYFVNKMGLSPGVVAKCPRILSLSLEKRIIPRCSVIQVLSLNGLLIKEKTSLNTVLVPEESYFLSKFVTKYKDKLPQLSRVYQGKMGVLDA